MGEPYFVEFLPLIRKAGGVRLFVPDIPYRWFLPDAGPAGDLRPEEIKYLALLIRHADRRQRIAVFGFARSLGRILAIRKKFLGFHIFQYRNIWTQWMSFLAQKSSGNHYFIFQMLNIMIHTRDHFLSAIINRSIVRSIEQGIIEHREYCSSAADRTEKLTAKLASLLPECELFTIYVAFHIYIYVIAQLNADLVVDATKLARDQSYRDRIRNQVNADTGLQISFNDVAEIHQYHPFDPTIIDWQEIKENLNFAAASLDHLFDREELLRLGTALVDETCAEIETSEKYLANARRHDKKLTSERDSLAAVVSTLSHERDRFTEQHAAAMSEIDRIARQRAAADVEIGKLTLENARLEKELAATHDTQSVALAALRSELFQLTADRDRATVQSERWFTAAIRGGLGSVFDSFRSGRDRRLHWHTRRFRKESPRSRADRARDARQWELAARYYIDELDRDPRPPAIWVQLGHALKEAGRVSEAESAYREAAKRSGNTLDTLLPLGHALIMLDKRAEAAVIYTRALDLQPSCALRQAIVEQLRALGLAP